MTYIKVVNSFLPADPKPSAHLNPFSYDLAQYKYNKHSILHKLNKNCNELHELIKIITIARDRNDVIEYQESIVNRPDVIYYEFTDLFIITQRFDERRIPQVIKDNIIEQSWLFYHYPDFKGPLFPRFYKSIENFNIFSKVNGTPFVDTLLNKVKSESARLDCFRQLLEIHEQLRKSNCFLTFQDPEAIVIFDEDTDQPIVALAGPQYVFFNENNLNEPFILQMFTLQFVRSFFFIEDSNTTFHDVDDKMLSFNKLLNVQSPFDYDIEVKAKYPSIDGYYTGDYIELEIYTFYEYETAYDWFKDRIGTDEVNHGDFTDYETYLESFEKLAFNNFVQNGIEYNDLCRYQVLHETIKTRVENITLIPEDPLAKYITLSEVYNMFEMNEYEFEDKFEQIKLSPGWSMFQNTQALYQTIVAEIKYCNDLDRPLGFDFITEFGLDDS